MISYNIENGIDQQYNTAIKNVKKLDKRPKDDELLLLYGLYKQVQDGDNTSSKPWIVDFKGVKKWEAWNLQKGKNVNIAKQEYIELVNSLSKKYA